MDSPDASADGRLDEAEHLLADLLGRRKAGDRVELKSLLEQRPDLEAELRHMWSQLAVVDEVLDADARQTNEGRARVEEVLQSLAASRGFSERYAIETEIGRGGMGVILRVVDRKLDRPLAMKVIVGQAIPTSTGKTPPIDAHQLVRFLNEARITSQLDHPGIVPVHEVGVDEDGRAYFTMKLVKGLTLSEVFERRAAGDQQWSTTRVLGAIQRVCEALAFAHEKRVIHRDLKPHNVMIGDFGEVYVMDWGLARRLDEAEVDARATAAVDEQITEQVMRTRDGRVLGTPAYMSPEQARGAIDLMGPQSDVYAIGAMLYQLIAGHAPYVQPAEKTSGAAILARVVAGPPERLHSPKTPPELIAICEKAMSYERSSRYGSVLEVAADLQRFIDGRVVAAFRSGPWQEAKKWVLRNQSLALASAAGLLALVAGLIFSTAKTREAQAAERETDARNKDLQIANAMIKENQLLAQTNEARANAQERLATQRADDVLSLSAIQDLKNLEDRANSLWPPDPEMVPKYEEWLADARDLIDGHASDPTKGIKKRPSLTEHEAKLAELRARAKLLTSEQVDADRKASPSFAEWQKERGHLQWMRRMLGEDPWPTETEIESVLAKETLPTDATALNDLAMKLVDVDPATIVYGDELRGLILARRAVAAAKESELPVIRDTLAWALFRCGRFDAALAEEQRALDTIVENRKGMISDRLKGMEQHIKAWTAEGWRGRRIEEAAILAGNVERLKSSSNRRQTFEFESSEDSWWHTQLATLVADMNAFRDEKVGGLYSAGTSDKHGWGILKRAEFARTIQERSITGSQAKPLWDEAVVAIGASPMYGGLRIKPQSGLLPIGADPESGLWEFAHLASGEPPVRRADRKLVLNESMGVVLVLMPGGTFKMGAQSLDPTGPNYDPHASGSDAHRVGLDESPVHDVELSPYFISKYEMTQGQWLRLTGVNPSECGEGHYLPIWNRDGRKWTSLHPVESVSWAQCMTVMTHVGLSLPSEAQWENGARGGTGTAYWTGSDVASLEGAANIADAYGYSHGGTVWDSWEKDLDDGNTVPAEVGSYRANPYGLCDVHGNVAEWCLDGYDLTYYARSEKKDPISPWQGAPTLVVRGGSFYYSAAETRIAMRNRDAPDYKTGVLGLRPARSVSR